MARLKASTVVTRPGDLAPTVLSAGDEVPSWAEGMVGDHLLEDTTVKSEPVVEGEAAKAEPEPEVEAKPRTRTRKG